MDHKRNSKDGDHKKKSVTEKEARKSEEGTEESLFDISSTVPEHAVRHSHGHPGHLQGHHGHLQGHDNEEGHPGHLQGHHSHLQGHDHEAGHLRAHHGHLQGHDHEEGHHGHLQGHDHEQGHPGHLRGHHDHLHGHDHEEGHPGHLQSHDHEEGHPGHLKGHDHEEGHPGHLQGHHGHLQSHDHEEGHPGHLQGHHDHLKGHDHEEGHPGHLQGHDHEEGHPGHLQGHDHEEGHLPDYLLHLHGHPGHLGPDHEEEDGQGHTHGHETKEEPKSHYTHFVAPFHHGGPPRVPTGTAEVWKKAASKIIDLRKPKLAPVKSPSTKHHPPSPPEPEVKEPKRHPLLPQSPTHTTHPIYRPEGLPSDIGMPFAFFEDTEEKRLKDTTEDKKIGERLSKVMDNYRGETKKKERKAKNKKYPKYSYADIVAMLTKQGIPVPPDEDFANLESSHGTRWDPDGTVVEYYSPVLRSFIPINMRGRYRGCWAEEKCIQGLDVSKLGPKPDALEGFVDRSRQVRIAAKYDAMGDVAGDEGHLDYLIEIQKYQSEILPIPIFYEVLNIGMETLNENLQVLALQEGYPPASRVYETTELQARHVRRKLQVYAGLGLEPLDSRRKGLGRMNPQWEMTRDEIIKSLLARRHQAKYILRMKEERKLAAKLRAEELDRSMGKLYQGSDESLEDNVKSQESMSKISTSNIAVNISKPELQP